MTDDLIKRTKSLLWRAGSMAFVAGAAYILQVGDIYALDYHKLTNLAALAFLGLVVGEVTKYINSNGNPL